MTIHDCFEVLANHLSKLPGGFKRTDNGIELRILRKLFTVDEAELAVKLSLSLEDPKKIAIRIDKDSDEVSKILKMMSSKGLAFSARDKFAETLYQALPWNPGIYEHQVNNLDVDFVRELNEYKNQSAKKSEAPVSKQIHHTYMRVVPIKKSLKHNSEIITYDNVLELVDRRPTIAVAPCMCRIRAELSGDGCDAPKETCLVFGDWGEFYVHNSRGRYIAKQEAYEILNRADESNLVLQPSDDVDISWICCCCGCCCPVLKTLKELPKPSNIVKSSFIASYNDELCEGCGTCKVRCQMEAIRIKNKKALLDPDRCIGCGLCTSTCPTSALKLKRKQPKIPQNAYVDIYDIWKNMHSE